MKYGFSIRGWAASAAMAHAALVSTPLAAASDHAVVAAPADTVIVNARIFRSTAASPWAEALAVKDGKVAAVGDAADVKKLIGPQTKVVDAGNRLVIPGIIDAHVHLAYSVKDMNTFNCSSPADASLDVLIQNIGNCAKKHKPGEWIAATSFGSTLIPQLQSADALRRLDEVSPLNPVVIRSDTVHDRWVNSAALKAANITAPRAVVNGTIGKDPQTGALNGLLIEPGATDLVDVISPIGKFNSPDSSELLGQGAALLNSFGVTGWVDAMSSPETAAAYRELAAAGRLHGRVGVSILVDTDKVKPADLPGLFASAGADEVPNVSAKFAKIFLDGTPVTKTAHVLHPYLPDAAHGANYHGAPKMNQAVLDQTVIALDAMGVSVKMHTTGDASVREALNAVAAARRANGKAGPMHTLAHAGHLAAQDIKRFPRLNVAFEASPTMWYPGPIMDAMIATLGKGRAEDFWRFRTYLAAGATVAGGTDWKTLPGEYSDLWSGIEGMVTRRNPTGRYAGVLHPEEALDVATAIRLYTIHSAKALRVDGVAGTLEVGKSADLAVLNQDIFDVDPDCISLTAPTLTMFEGRIVFQSKESAAPKCEAAP